MPLSKYELDEHEWFYFYQKQRKKRGIFPETVFVMSSNVHEWRGKSMVIVWFQYFIQKIIRNKVTTNDSSANNRFKKNDEQL